MSSKVLMRISIEQRAAEQAQAAESSAWMRDMASEVPASELSPQQKQQVWAHLKARYPEHVAFLNDPDTKALMQLTGAVPTFPRDIVRAALHLQTRSPRHAA